MDITKVVKPFIRRGANTFGNIVYIYVYINVIWMKKIPYPLTNMSLDFSPVKMSSSSRTTSSVFHTITLSSNLSMTKAYLKY